MTSVLIIAECGSNWRFGDKTRYHVGEGEFTPDELMNAYRMIRAAKECGADAAKFQWVSSPGELMKRRGEKDDEETRRVYSYVHFDPSWLPLLKAECDRVGIEFMCTAYLPQDVAVIAPFVKRFKVAAKEQGDKGLCFEIDKHAKPVVVSFHKQVSSVYWHNASLLWCVSKYPCPLEEIGIKRVRGASGLSDHTGHVLTGAMAVANDARIIESHVRLHDTPRECPDYGHSLTMWNMAEPRYEYKYETDYAVYVQNIRTAERML